MEPTPVDPRIQHLFEKMADEYENEFALISWDALRKEAIFQFYDENATARRASVSLKEFLRCVGDNGLSEETLVEVCSMSLLEEGWCKDSFPKVVVSMLPSAVLAIITR
jgi:hypothetical protein